MGLEGKHIVISGGGSGVGAALTKALSEAGTHVTILGRRPAPLEQVAQQTGALALACDVSDRPALDAALATARDENGPFYGAIANTGAALSKPFARMQASDLTAMLQANLTSTFNLWQAVLADMQQGESGAAGRLIAIASSTGRKGYPYVSAYVAAKHAVVGLTRALTAELASSAITVNAICPGFVETPMLARSLAHITAKTGMNETAARAALMASNPQGRFIEVDEVASAALWLLGHGAHSVTGQTLSINGGET